MNKVFLIGKLAWMPDLRLDRWNRPYVSVSMIINPKNSKHPVSQRFNLFFKNGLAEIVAQYCEKNSFIFIEGSLKTRKWTDGNGKTRYYQTVFVRHLQILEAKKKVERIPVKHVPAVDIKYEYSSSVAKQ